MPFAPAPLPPELASAGFTIADARRFGVTRDRLRAADLSTPFRGMRIPREGVSRGRPPIGVPATRPLEGTADEATPLLGRAADEANRVELLARCRAALTVLPQTAAFSHLTAARLQRLPVPHHYRPDEPLEVTCPSPSGRVRRPGIVGHRGLESRTVELVDGVPLVTGPDTWADLAVRVSLEALVALGDRVVHREQGLPIDELILVRDSRPGWPGSRRMDGALPYIRRGSESPQESRTRMRFADAGLPEPELNAMVDDRGGEWIATGDFVWRAARVLAEFDGDHHRVDRRQWQRDVARRELCCENGWTYVQLTAESVGSQLPRTVTRLRRLVNRTGSLG